MSFNHNYCSRWRYGGMDGWRDRVLRENRGMEEWSDEEMEGQRDGVMEE
jgi:hypothetical protein